jgi:hypothetical protein
VRVAHVCSAWLTLLLAGLSDRGKCTKRLPTRAPCGKWICNWLLLLLRAQLTLLGQPEEDEAASARRLFTAATMPRMAEVTPPPPSL